eukprot:8520073-Pyramimonas_sp.AAC.1
MADFVIYLTPMETELERFHIPRVFTRLLREALSAASAFTFYNRQKGRATLGNMWCARYAPKLSHRLSRTGDAQSTQ